MACQTPTWFHAKNSTTACPHPAIANCAECDTPLCSSHIVECDVCGRFVCRECALEHQVKHERAEVAAA